MNKVFKVVYSKSKGCYVVVPETAKNNNGKKKVLASVLAGLALVGAAGVTPVHATLSADGSIDTNNSRINIKTANTVGDYGDQTVGVNSVAVGYGNSTNNEDGTIVYGAANKATANAAIALGNRNEASGGNAVALGTSNTATNVKTIAIGNKSNANADGAIAIGAYNNQNYIENSSNTTPKQAGGNSIVVGNYSHAGGRQSVAIGNNATTQHDDSVAIGADVSALAGHNIAIGSGGTKAQSAPGKTGSAAIAIGLNAQATYGTDTGAFDMIAIGNQTTASANAATAIGTLSKATANNSTAIGNKAQATASGTLAIGQVTNASAHGAVALGNGAQSNGVGSTSLGRTAKATNDGSVAVGFNAEATGDHAIAIGGDGKGEAFTDSPNTFAGLNQKTTASATNSISVGHNAKASIVDGVALGSSSVTTTDKGVLGYNPSDPHERKYAPLTGNVQTATTAAVSIGNGSTLTRQLTGLAAGTADTDAVNVAQLKNVGVAVTGNTGKSDFLTDGGKLNVIGTGRVSTVAAHDGAKDSRITVGFDDTGMVKAGKNVTVDEKTVNGRTTYTINAADTAAKYDFLTNAKANGGKVDGTAKPATVQSGTTVNYAAGKNLTVKQDIDQSIGEQTYTYSLNSDLGGITSITNNGGTTMHFGPDNISITGGNLDLGDNNITNLKSGGDVTNNAANIGDVTRISKANDKHIKPGEYAVDNNGKVTMTYVDGNNKDVPNETAVITGIAKQDLSNINNGGKTVIKNLAKEAIDMENGKNTTASHRDVNGVKTFKVDVEGDLTDITSITNKAGDGKIAFGGNQTVNVAGDHNIAINAKAGDITGLTNVTLDAPDFAKKGRAATEEQLNIVNNKFNNTVGLTGNTGATELQKLNKQGGLSFGVVGANNGEYIKTTAAGSDVVADLSDSAKNKLNSTVEVQGKNAAKVTSNVVQNADGSTKTIYTVDVNNVTPTAASTEKVQAKADVAGSSDKNIAKVSPKAGDQFGEAGATYEVNVSRNDVKDAAREAVTVNTTNTTNNPITVTPVQDEANHNTTYQVTFDGEKAAKQIPLTYKANGTNEQKVTLDKGLNFTNGKNTTASVDAEGVVKYDVNKDLVNINSISNTTNGPKMEFGPNSINITNGPINMGDQNITNLKSGGDVVNNAANIGDVTRISKANDLHIAPTSSNRQGETTTSYAYDAASKSVTLKYNDGNGANQSGTVAKIDLSGLADQIKDGYSFSTDAKGNVVGNHAVTPVGNGKTVSYAAGKNLTVAQNIDNATGEHTYTYALSNDVDLTPNGSLKIGDTILNNGGLTITGGPSVTKTGINAGNLNITNVKAGVNDTDAVNVKQLKDARTVVTSNDNSVTVNKTENGNQVTYDLHVAPGAAQSVWNVKSTGNTTADSETAPKTISDGKTVEMAAGKNLTVKQTSNNDGAKVEFDLANDIKIGKDGKDGVDGKIGVNGKDGSSVVINGKDGSIGLNGKDGKDGLTMKGEKGADGVTRIVYEDNTNNKHEVATLDDGLRFDANSGGEKKNKLGSKVTVKGTGAKADSEYDSSNIKTSITQGADGNSEINIGLAKDLNNINTIKNGGPATFTIGGNEFKFDGGNVNMGGNNITNLKSGIVNNNSTDDTNGANIGDVKTISKANDLHIAPTTSNRTGETTTSYAYDTASKSVTLKYNDGNGANQAGTIAKIDLSGLADQIKDGYSFSTDAKGNVVGNHAVTAVANGKTVSYAAGDNLTVKQDIDATTGEHTYTYALSNDIKVGKDGKDGIDGKIGVNGKDGSSVVINGKDGSIGLNGKDGKDGLTIRGEKGQDGVDGKNGTNGITRIVYEDNSKHTHEVATLDDGMKYAGDDAQGADKSKVIAKKLNETMDVVGGADKSKLTDNNIGVNNVDGKLKVQLSKEVNLTPSGSLTIGDTVVNNNGLTISGGPSITKTGINAGNKTIVNVDAGVNDTDAVNVKQLKTAKTEVKAGNNVTVDTTYGNDGHTIYTVNANDVALGDAVLKYSANGTNTQSVKLSQGLNFVDGNYTSASVDANGQVKYDVTIGKVKDGVDGKPGVDGKDGIATVKTVVDTINNSGWKGDVTGNTVNNHTATIVKPGTTVNFGAGKNLTVEQIVNAVTGDHTYNYALSDDIKVGKDGKDGVDGKIGVNGKDGSSVVINGKDGSIGLNGKDGKDGLTMKAKDGQPGVNGKDGITRIVYEDNSKNTHEVATLDDGMKYAGDDAQGTDKSKVIAKKLNQTMDIVGGANSTKLTDNNIGVNNVDGKLKVQLAQNIDLTPAGSLTIGGTSITDNGLVINQGPSITKGGINAGNKTIVNVAPGVNGTDAVNVNQLNSARTEVEEGDNVTVTSRTGANGQTIYKVSATGVNLGDAELKYSANGTNTQSVKLSKGLNFVDGNYTSASVDANGQVKYDVNLGNIKQGTDGKPGVDGKDGIATVKTVVDTINNSGWKANATGNVVGTSTATIVKPGSTVNYGAGKNLNVKQTVNGEEQTYEFALDKDLKELNSVQTNTIHLGSPTSHTTINYNAGNDRIEYTTKNGTKQVANLDDIWTIQANGTDVKPVGGKVNVVGGDHIKVSTDAAGKMTISADGVGTMNGFNVKSTGNTTNDSDKTAKNITDGKTVEFSGGKNLTVKQTNTADGAKVEFALNNNIDLTPNGSVTIGDTVVNNDGLTITGGPTITKNNVDMGGQQIHNVKSGGDVDSNGANIGDIKRISKANDTRIKDGNYEVSQNGTVEMTYVDGSGKQLVDEHGNPVKATISGIARQDLSNITNEGKKVITGLGTIVKAGQNVSVDEATDNATGQKTYTVNADLSGAKVYAGVGTDGSGVAKGLKNPAKVEKGTQYIAGDNMVVERKPVEGDDKLDNSITYSLAHDLTEINSISNGGATLRINSNPGGNKYDRDTAVTPAFEVHGGNLSMTGNRIVNLAPGIDGTDGVNVNQLRDSLTTVKSTDGTVRVTDLSTDPNKHEYDLHVNPAADPRVDKLGEEIGHVGAQSAALSALKPIQYDPMEPTQIMAGYGNYRGNSALALGVAHYKNESTMFHAGVSWAGGNGHMMANAGVTWKVGNRDSEAAVADRYRKGPISSTYAMQTEVASMKAQNAGLKGEVSDLKAENEQIKAQNAGLQSEVDQLKAQMAAMMAKLGM